MANAYITSDDRGYWQDDIVLAQRLTRSLETLSRVLPGTCTCKIIIYIC